MIFSFFKKKETEQVDLVIEEHIQQTHVRLDHDIESIRERFEAEYPSPESAVEDFRKGYVTEAELKMRFSDEEMDLVYREKKERDRENDEGMSAVSHS